MELCLDGLQEGILPHRVPFTARLALRVFMEGLWQRHIWKPASRSVAFFKAFRSG